MSNDHKSILSRCGNYVYQALVLSGIVATLWLNQNYVTRMEFKEMDGRLRKIEEVLIRMEAGAATDVRHDLALNDHETRLRLLEKK